MGTTDGSWTYSGWNLDDVQIWGNVTNPSIPGDIDGNGTVGIGDLLMVIENWGPCDAPCPSDINGDGVTNIKDLLIVLNNWGSRGRRASMPGAGEHA